MHRKLLELLAWAVGLPVEKYDPDEWLASTITVWVSRQMSTVTDGG